MHILAFQLSPTDPSHFWFKKTTVSGIPSLQQYDQGRFQAFPEESLMLTGDENIVDINYSVFWVIKDAGKFLFKIQSPVVTVKAAAETAMREVIAKSRL